MTVGGAEVKGCWDELLWEGKEVEDEFDGSDGRPSGGDAKV